MCEGLRPTILEDIMSYYMELLKKCWNKDLEERPSASEIYETITYWKSNKEILASFSKSDKEMIKYYAFDFNEDLIKEVYCPDRIISKFERLVTRNYTPAWFGDMSEVNIRNNISEKEKIQQCCIVNDADSPDEAAL
ncbi:hypothetical protein C2G38_2227974 [Gigaspora rosea]|uniref:Serine-threonine/tyrosine-protein kinase catalytic domain-containing protein n=1 Tax=Gigaspora rosea TaxID=44941 RepID=A0A397U4P0_9GLOM|nr:hypothetical protein C2G38_2227974 [Gigaspora rosea]